MLWGCIVRETLSLSYTSRSEDRSWRCEFAQAISPHTPFISLLLSLPPPSPPSSALASPTSEHGLSFDLQPAQEKKINGSFGSPLVFERIGNVIHVDQTYRCHSDGSLNAPAAKAGARASQRQLLWQTLPRLDLALSFSPLLSTLTILIRK